ncbi:MAG: CHASE2 domain-containing protein [Gammaproteobacteria bacterium]|nr:CHASE2 domain-containing protein [Gammaproteobacteria bacterium]
MESAQAASSREASKKKLIQLIGTTVLAIVLGVFEEVADPFGLDTQSDRLSANIYNTITSPLYGAASELAIDGKDYESRLGQSNVVVLLIDDTYLDSTDQRWPLQPRRYQRVLRKLVDANASTVFVDIYFAPNTVERQNKIADLYRRSGCLVEQSYCSVENENWRCGNPESGSACIERSATAGTDILFASTLNDPRPAANGIAPPGAALAQMRSDDNIYNLRQAAFDGEQYDTAGWALYKSWCRRNPDECDTGMLNDPEIPAMYLHWGYAPNRVMTEIPDLQGQACIPQATSLPGRLWQSMKIFGWNFFRGFHDARIAPCPYSMQIKLQLFNNLSEGELRQLFEDKVVILGAALKNYPDYQWSPVHDYIPGAFWHAMAADNLIEFSSGYMKQSESAATSYLEPVGLTLIFLLQAWLTWIIQRRGELEDLDERSQLELDLMHGLFTICIISAAVLWITGFLRWSPANWIGFAMLMFLIDFKPVTAVPRYCWTIFPPMRMTHRLFSVSTRFIRATLMALLLLSIGYVIMVLPHALLLAQVADSTVISVSFMVAYVGTMVFCLYKIVGGNPS